MATTINTGGTGLPQGRFNKKAIITFTSIKSLASSLADTNFISQLKDMFTEKTQYINSIKWYPFDCRQGQFLGINYGPQNLTLGGHTCQDEDSHNISVDEVDTIEPSVLVAEISIPSHYNNFMDYEPYTTAQIYLPYLGFYPLPIKDCIGFKIKVYYSVDFDTGIATAYVVESQNRVILTASGKIGIDIPLGTTNANEIARKNFENGAKLVASVFAIGVGAYTGNIVGGMLAVKGVETAISSGVNVVTAQQQHYQRGSLTGGQDSLPAPTTPYVVIYRPHATFTDTTEYRKVKGMPLGEVKILGNVSGFTTVEEIHLEGFGDALKTEVDEIESLLHEGVIL